MDLSCLKVILQFVGQMLQFNESVIFLKPLVLKSFPCGKKQKLVAKYLEPRRSWQLEKHQIVYGLRPMSFLKCTVYAQQCTMLSSCISLKFTSWILAIPVRSEVSPANFSIPLSVERKILPKLITCTFIRPLGC